MPARVRCELSATPMPGSADQLGVGYATPPVHPDIDVVIGGEQQETDTTLDSPDASSTRSRSASTRVGSCWVTRSPKRPACSRWRNGSTGSSRSAGSTRQGRRAVLGSEVTPPHC